MKKLLITFTFIIFLFGFIQSVNAANNDQAATSSDERVILVFKNKVDKNLVTQSKGKIKREYQNSNILSISVPSTALKGLKNNPNILAVEPDVLVKVKSQTIDWGTDKIQAPTAWSSSLTGKGIKIGVVDSGIANHDDLTIAGGTAFTSYTGSYLDDNGHGTHVAGIIGAKNNDYGIAGVASDASLYAVKVLDSNGSGYLSDILAGIDWCITNKMDIINLSLGSSTPSIALQQEVDKAYSSGILVVAAAGNDGTIDGTTDTVDYPAKYDSVIAVAATNSSNERAYFSSTGSTIEVAAPGYNIRSTYLNNQYAALSGTSMAAPFVTGDLALLKQANPELSVSQLRAKLRENAVDLGSVGKDNWFGYGLIQAPKAQTLQVIQPAPSITTPQTTSTDTSGTTTSVTTQPNTSTPKTTSPVTTQPNVGTPVTTSPVATQPNTGTPVITSPVTTQPDKRQTNTVVSTNKTSYLPKQKITMKVKVTNYLKKPIRSARIYVYITSPTGKITAFRGITNRNGELTLSISTVKNAVKGMYSVDARATYNNYLSSSASASFQIR